MKVTKLNQKLKVAAVIFLANFLFACGSTGRTDAKPEVGESPVSDGGFGAKIELEYETNVVSTGEIVEIHAKFTDSEGRPVTFQPLQVCSEQGIGVAEPTVQNSAQCGVASTNLNGVLSFKIAGLCPGSFLLEVRASEGYDVKKQVMFKVVGDALSASDPAVAGIAGGGLGGGSITCLQ